MMTRNINLSCAYFFLFITASFGQSKVEKLTSLLDTYHQLNEFNGTALVSQYGKVLINEGYGFKNIATNDKCAANTIYQIGSITKQFTAAIILKLEEKKKLKLTDKVSKYFPDYPNGNEITIHHLLSHTSGIFNYTNDVDFMKSEAVKPINEAKMLALFKDRKLDFAPGTQWSYSNSGYVLLGYIIQKVTKKPYEKVVREYIFKPMKMLDSGFDFVGLNNKNKAKGYFGINGKNSMESTYVDSTVSYAAGAIYSTTSDLLKWHTGLIKNKVIKRATLEKAFTPVKNNYGYGWGISNIDDKKITTHTGGIFGFNTNIARIEQDDICVVLLNNMGNPKLVEITNNIFAILYDKVYTLPTAKKEIAISQEVLNKYKGTYQIVPEFKIVVTVADGKLFAQATGQPKFELFAQKENYFFLKAVEAEVEFVSNNDGKVEKLILYQGGRNTPAMKLID
jgi:CubicO group peptidase (beta-lactamase class C family)